MTTFRPTRRQVLTQRLAPLAGLLLTLAATPTQAQPAEFPNKPVRIIVGFAAGTPPDIFARLYGEYAAKKLGVPFVIENRPGSAGNLASDAVAKAPADGYTVLYNVSAAITINPFIYSKLPFGPTKDLQPVATTMRQGLVLIAAPLLPYKSLAEVLEQARKKPGSLSHASYGAGSPSHLIMEWLKEETKTDMLHVPYRTTPINELIGGQVDLLLEPIATATPMIAAGRAKALAYSGAQRHPSLPNVPTFAETAPGLSVTSWHGIWAPAATPAAVVEKLHATLLAASRDADVQRRIKELNSEPLGLSRTEMADLVKRDADIFKRVVAAKGITLD
jgi:tripartite-type tricarboxylate transporter receptor subunit TctC